MRTAMATVTSQDGANYRVNVILEGMAGGSMPTVSVDVLTHGPRDGLRIEQHPLPTKGTRGIVLFPRDDPRSGVWIGATAGPLLDASTTRPGFENVHYSARWSGFWRLQDEQGNEVLAWPDGSTLTVGTAPQATRHVVTGPGQQEQQPFSQVQRVKTPPGAFPFNLKTASGVQITIDGTGNVSVLVPTTSQVINLGAIGEALHKLVNDTFLSLFNIHTHGGVLPGGSSTDVPAPQMTSTNLTTVLTAG